MRKRIKKKLTAWIGRNWALVFYRSQCFQLKFEKDPGFEYGDIVEVWPEANYKCLGKGWYTYEF